MWIQAIGRARRFGNPSPVVKVIDLLLKDSFMERQMDPNLRKAIPGITAELNKTTFAGGDDADGDNEVALGEFFIHNNRLMPWGQRFEIRDETGRLPELAEPEEIVAFIISGNRDTVHVEGR